jgi:hypothetical protein
MIGPVNAHEGSKTDDVDVASYLYPQRGAFMKLVCRGRWRYSLSSFLTLIAIVGFACFWVTWPRRTAEQFVVEYFRDLDVIANPFREGTPAATAFEQDYKPRKRELKLVVHKRTTMDLLVGRQTFDCEMHEFTVCRGAVISGPTQYWDSAFRSYR